MKRIAVAAAMAAAAFVVSPAAPAHAEGCEYSIAQFPDECLSQAVYEYVTGLQADDQDLRVHASLVEADAYQLRTQMWQLGLDLQASRQATSVAITQRDAAIEQIDRLELRIVAQRATIKRLRDRLHAII